MRQPIKLPHQKIHQRPYPRGHEAAAGQQGLQGVGRGVPFGQQAYQGAVLQFVVQVGHGFVDDAVACDGPVAGQGGVVGGAVAFDAHFGPLSVAAKSARCGRGGLIVSVLTFPINKPNSPVPTSQRESEFNCLVSGNKKFYSVQGT